MEDNCTYSSCTSKPLHDIWKSSLYFLTYLVELICQKLNSTVWDNTNHLPSIMFTEKLRVTNCREKLNVDENSHEDKKKNLRKVSFPVSL